MSIYRWVGKEDTYMCVYIYIYICIYNGILLSHIKKEIMLFAVTWMDLEMIMLSEVSQTEKDKCHMISLIYGIWFFLKKDINELIYKTDTDLQISKTNVWSPQRGHGEEGQIRNLGWTHARCYIQITNKDLLSGTGSPAWHFLTTYIREASEKVWMHV